MTEPTIRCQHRKTEEQHDDTFDTIMGVELLTRARVLTVCSDCGAILRDEPNDAPEVNLSSG